ncbi:hypothetical protein OY671_010534, partial [Metschnikowia pulcherrima]
EAGSLSGASGEPVTSLTGFAGESLSRRLPITSIEGSVSVAEDEGSCADASGANMMDETRAAVPNRAAPDLKRREKCLSSVFFEAPRTISATAAPAL